MGPIAFDTHAFVKRLTDAGMPEPQAEVLAGEQARLTGGELATRHDIEALRAATERDIAAPRAEITASAKRMKAGILKGMFAALLGQTAVLGALVKLPWPRSGKPRAPNLEAEGALWFRGWEAMLAPSPAAGANFRRDTAIAAAGIG